MRSEPAHADPETVGWRRGELRGKGRLLINDRNWVVVSQAPAAGAKVPLDTKIVLRSKKIGE